MEDEAAYAACRKAQAQLQVQCRKTCMGDEGTRDGDQQSVISQQSPESGPNRGSLFSPQRAACGICRQLHTSRHFQNVSELGSFVRADEEAN
jgi:hypothetical protein